MRVTTTDGFPSSPGFSISCMSIACRKQGLSTLFIHDSSDIVADLQLGWSQTHCLSCCVHRMHWTWLMWLICKKVIEHHWTNFTSSYFHVNSSRVWCACSAIVRTVISQTLHLWLVRCCDLHYSSNQELVQNWFAWGWKWWTTWATTPGWDHNGTFFVQTLSWFNWILVYMYTV